MRWRIRFRRWRRLKFVPTRYVYRFKTSFVGTRRNGYGWGVAFRQARKAAPGTHAWLILARDQEQRS